MGMRALAVLAAVLPSARAQITGAICSTFEDANPFYPSDRPRQKLCIPQFCAAPKPFNQQIGTGIFPPIPVDGVVPVPNPYEFWTPRSDGEHNFVMNFTVDTRPDLHGYNLHDICGEAVTFALTAARLPGAPSPPSPPLYSSAKGTPTGCQAISPLPTLLQSLDRALIFVWLLLIVFLFYALAMVCEEFLVPAINILCVKTGIPDDVAGATLLAAGCNSPEFFASIIGIFVADSTVGVGTVLGSAPFNLCCITGGAALAVIANGGALHLDPWLMARELFGLCVSLLLFLIFMDDYRIEWWEALVMVLFYCFVYVPMLAKWDAIKGFLLSLVSGRYEGQGADPMLGDEEVNPLAINFRTGSTKVHDAAASRRRSVSGERGESQAPDLATSAFDGLSGHLQKSLSQSIAGTKRVTFGMKDMVRASQSAASLRHFAQAQVQIELQPVALLPPGDPPSARQSVRSSFANPPTTLGDLVDKCKMRCASYEGSEDGFQGLLLKKPRGYVKVRMRGIMWQERHFILDNHPTNPLRYSHKDQKSRFVTLPLQDVTHIERVGLDEMHLTTPTETYKLRIPDREPSETMQRWFDQIVVKIDSMGFAPPPPSELVGGLDDDELTKHDHPPWWKMPHGAGVATQIIFYSTFLIKAMVFTTTPNVLIKANEKYYPVTIVVSMVWLAVFAILMTDVIEYLGCGIGIDPTVMGLSLGAIGTSFPNLYASILVAKSGQGGMAICQAIASNTFNICICLALLWLFHTIGLGGCDYGSHGAYHGQCNGCYAPSGFQPLCPYLEGGNNEFGSSPGSTKGAVLLSLFWVAVFLISLVTGKLHVTKPAAIVMFGIYILYIGYQFAAAFVDGLAICFQSVNICI